MQNDYYAFNKSQLSDCLNELEQAAIELEKAKKIKDNEMRKQAKEKAEKQIEIASEKAVKIEPHLAYCWYKSLASDLENEIRIAWQKHLVVGENLDGFCFNPNISDLNHLPLLSFILQIQFRLKKSYLSKNDCDFHLLDNPVRREKVFQKPMVASTSWKGTLRSVLIQQLVEWWCNLSENERKNRTSKKEFIAKRVHILKLFGTEKGIQIDDEEFIRYLDKFDEDLASWYRRYVRRFISSTGFLAGRLYFYPTFFNKAGIEVINRHDRKTGVGKGGPIFMECVPQGEIGKFTLLYVPFGLVNESDIKQRLEVAQDLERVAEGVCAMLTTYGFGAKTSSGFGIAEDEVNEGKLAIKADLLNIGKIQTDTKPSEPKLSRYLIALGQLHPDFKSSDGGFRSEAEYEAFLKSQKRQYNRKDKQLYEKAYKWWEREGRQLAKANVQPPDPKPAIPSLPQLPFTEVSFTSFSNLYKQVQCVVEKLNA